MPKVQTTKKQPQNLDQKLIKEIISLLPEKVDEDEKLFLFDIANTKIKEHIKFMNKNGAFDSWYAFENKKKIKQTRKNIKDDKKFSILNITAEDKVENDTYQIIGRVAGPVSVYVESIIKKKMYKFANVCKLIYLEIFKNGESIYKEGQEHIGKEVNESNSLSPLERLKEKAQEEIERNS